MGSVSLIYVFGMETLLERHYCLTSIIYYGDLCLYLFSLFIDLIQTGRLEQELQAVSHEGIYSHITVN